MNARPADKLAIAVAQLNPTVGDIAGNAEKVRRARAAGGRAGRRSRRLSRTVHRRLSARGPGAQAGLPGRLPRGDRSAGARNRRRRARRCSSARPGSTTASSTTRVALLEGGAIAALRYKVDLPNYGVFDEKRVFAPGPMPGPVSFRGVRLGLPICEDIWTGATTRTSSSAWPRPAPNCWSCRTARPIGTAVGRRAAQRRGAARHRSRAAADLRQPGRRAGRTGVRRRLVRPATPTARWRSSLRLYQEVRRHHALACGDGATWRCDDGPKARGGRSATAPTTRPACSACATMSTRTASPAWCSACRAASIPRCARRWRSMRWARSACAA